MHIRMSECSFLTSFRMYTTRRRREQSMSWSYPESPEEPEVESSQMSHITYVRMARRRSGTIWGLAVACSHRMYCSVIRLYMKIQSLWRDSMQMDVRPSRKLIIIWSSPRRMTTIHLSVSQTRWSSGRISLMPACLYQVERTNRATYLRDTSQGIQQASSTG